MSHELNDPDSYAYGAALDAQEKHEERAIEEHKQITRGMQTAFDVLASLKGHMSDGDLSYVWDAIVEGLHTQIEKGADTATADTIRDHMDDYAKRAYPGVFS